MNTDKELLELAAKAAGWLVLAETKGLVCSRDDALKGGLCIRTGAEFDSIWNPLTDDGDALRLAVKLHLVIGAYGTYSSVCGTYTPDGYEVPDEIVVFHSGANNDPNASIRRAIVQCAAEIGKTL